MADRIEEVLVSDKLTDYRELIETRDMFFLATSDDIDLEEGNRLRVNGQATIN